MTIKFNVHKYIESKNEESEGGEFFFKFYCHLLHARIGEELFLVNKTQASESWGSVGGSDLANHSSLSLFLHKNHS